MNPSAPFILRPVMTTLLMLSLFILGMAAYFNLPVSDLPDVNFPTITVTVLFPGANPTIMANTVATPLEKEFMTIPGIKNVISSNTLGTSSIILEFEINKNIDLAAVDVDAAITRAKTKLPPDLPQDPTYKKVNPSSTPVLYLSVTSPTMTQGDLYDYAYTFIGQHISTIEGVSDVEVLGAPFSVKIRTDPGQLAYLNLTQQEVALAVSQGNQYQPLGQFDGNKIAAPIYDNGGLYKANEYNSLVVDFKDQAPIFLKEIGNAIDSIKNDRAKRRYISGEINQPTVTLAIKRQPGANAVKIVDATKKLLPKLQKQLPGSLDIFVLFDRAESIRNSTREVELTLFIAFLLVVIVIYFYLGKFKDTIIPSIVMPLSIIATFSLMYLFNYTIDNLSLLALILAIGFIIDDAIVVLENIVRRIETGESPLEASLNGSKQIAFTIISMTLSLAAVFIPLIFMAGIIGKLFQEFAVTLTIVTLLSGFISLTLTPLLCSRFLPPNMKEDSLGIKFNTWMLEKYKKGLGWVLNHRLFIIFLGALSVILSIILIKIIPTDFIPEEDLGFIIAYTEAEQGTSSDQMNDYQMEIVELLKKEPTIQTLVSIMSAQQYRQGFVLLKLVDRKDRKFIHDLVQKYSKKLKAIPGINVYFKVIQMIDLNIGTQVRGAYQYLMQSWDQKELYQEAQLLYDKMRLDPYFNGVSSDLEIKTPQLNLDIQREYASTLGIDVQNIEQALFLGYSGNRISRIKTPVDQYDVILEYDRDLQRTPSSLNDIYLRSDTTKELIPLSAVAYWKDGVGPASVNHFAQFPAVTITFNVAKGVALSDALKRLRELAHEGSQTTKVLGEVKGAAETFETAFKSLGFLFLITILTIYFVLGILYESFIHPFTILSTLPPAILGALLTLYFTGTSLSLYAYLGLILLIGIVKKNGIMMVDFALDNIKLKGESAEKSIFDASLVRFRPIMMTTLAAIMGAIPIAIGFGTGAEARRPLGYVIIGGMVVSQMITLFLTPVVFLYLEKFREKVKTTSEA